MKNTRKKMLLSSVAMLLVALVALGSATYAWFTINKTVQANTIKVNAGVPTGLEITNTNGKDWSRTVSYTGDYALTPASVAAIDTITAVPESAFYPKDVAGDGVASATTKAWQTLTVGSERPDLDTADKSDATGTVAAIQGVKHTGSGATNYFAEYRMGIKSSDTTKDLGAVNATIACATGTGDPDKFAKALLIREDVSGSSTTETVVGFYNDAKYTPIKAVAGDSYTLDDDEVDPSTTTQATDHITTAKYYRLLVWFEGNDVDCKNQNSGADANFTVSFTLAS